LSVSCAGSVLVRIALPVLGVVFVRPFGSSAKLGTRNTLAAPGGQRDRRRV